MIFCKKQLGEAIVAFRKVLAGDEEWLKIIDDLELQDDFEEDPDSCDEYPADCEEDEGDNDEAVARERTSEDMVMPSASMQWDEEHASAVNLRNHNTS